jgi:uncharacterized membrane protein (UPF0127 family)
MIRRFVRLAAVLILVLLVAPHPGVAQSNPVLGFAFDRLSVETADGAVHEFSVELALTPQQMAQGLMFRTRLDADAGMMFNVDPPRPISMWMKNTLISLDMLFIEADGRIAAIEAETTPGSLESVASGMAVRAVLELSAGTAARLSIASGDLVHHGWFAPAP